MYYPIDCAFFPNMLSEGVPCDALAVSQVPVTHGAVIKCRPIGALLMEDELNRPPHAVLVRWARKYPVRPSGFASKQVSLVSQCDYKLIASFADALRSSVTLQVKIY